MAEKNLRWQIVASRQGPELPLFNVRLNRVRHPSTNKEFERLVLDSTDWINVVATTEDGRIVMVEQYRFGVDDLTIEPVGGIVDEGEDPLAAAKRELLEETGFGGGDWHSLGAIEPNPAFHNNRCHLWWADGVRELQPQQLDPGEAIAVHLMTLDEVRIAIAAGRCLHSLGLAALSRVYPLWVPAAEDDR